jgi:hypothetical protein
MRRHAMMGPLRSFGALAGVAAGAFNGRHTLDTVCSPHHGLSPPRLFRVANASAPLDASRQASSERPLAWIGCPPERVPGREVARSPSSALDTPSVPSLLVVARGASAMAALGLLRVQPTQLVEAEVDCWE